MSEVSAERVLVVPTALFRQLGYFQGFTRDVDRYFTQLLSPEHTQYRPRHEVEHDPAFKQLIPYVILRHQPAAAGQTVFQYTRGTGMGEGRLHKKRSVGIGGHISTVDAAASDGCPYGEGMRRELDEEIRIDSPYTSRCVGLINDDQTEVGQVHLGVVHLFDLERPAVEPREDDVLECAFRPVDQILADLDGFETWSQICMQALFGEA